MTGPRSPMFSQTRHVPRRSGLRAVGIVLALVALMALLWAATVGGLWLYAWLRLGGAEVPAFSDDLTTLGVDGAGAPSGATTVLVTMTGPVDPTVRRASELVGPLVLLQYGGPRAQPVALAIPEGLTVAVDGRGELSFAEVQLEGGEDLLIRAVVDHTEVLVDHVVSVSSDALPRLLEILGDLEVCGTGGCSRPTSAELEVALAQSDGPQYVRTVADLVRAAATRVEPSFVARSPLATKRLIDVVSDEVTTDVSLRGARLLEVADALRSADDLAVDEVPVMVDPASQRIVARPEPAAVRFQHLRDGTPFTTEDDIGSDELPVVADVRVAVLNGAGIDGLAGRLRLRLESAGYAVVGTGNAPDFGRETTVVSYTEGDPTVEYVAVLLSEELGGAALEPLAEAPTFEGDAVDVLVTAGEDQDG